MGVLGIKRPGDKCGDLSYADDPLEAIPCDGIVRLIHEEVSDKQFTVSKRVLGKCRRCGKPLRDELSASAEAGPVCSRHLLLGEQ